MKMMNEMIPNPEKLFNEYSCYMHFLTEKINYI